MTEIKSKCLELYNLLTEEQKKKDILVLEEKELSKELKDFFTKNPNLTISYSEQPEIIWGVVEVKTDLWEKDVNGYWVVRIYEMKKVELI